MVTPIGTKKATLFSHRESAGNRRVGQPGERDVVEDVVSRQALGLAREAARDELVAADVMVQEPGGEADRRIRDPVERLRAGPHLLGIGRAVAEQEVEPFERTALLGRETGGGGVPVASAAKISGGTAAGMLVWMPTNSGGACTPICSVTSAPQSPPCAT